MGIEFGAKNAVCRPDQKVLDAIKKNAKCDRWEAIWADEDAVYAKEYHYDLGDLVPGVAKPHKVDNYAPIDEVKGTKIHEAFLGSCTNGRLQDLEAAASILKGHHVAVRMEKKVLETVAAKGVRDLEIDIEDNGAIDIVLGARVECAIDRLGGAQ